MGARLLKSTNRFTAYSSYPIELKLGSMILDINPHNRSASHFSVPLRGSCEGVPLRSPSIHRLHFGFELAITWEDDTRHQSAPSLGVGFSDFLQGRCGGAPFVIFNSIHSL